MRFFKRFSFRHRRVKSDSAAMPQIIPQTTVVACSRSVEELNAAVYVNNVSTHDMVQAVSPSASLQHTLAPTIVPIADRRIQALQVKIDQLIAANHEWSRDYRQLQGEAMENQSEKFIALSSGAAARRELQAAKAEVEKLEAKLAHYERFLGLIISIGLHELVLDKAHAALRKGLSADDALVEAIKEAAAQPGSAWASIMPAIVGPRPPEQYVAAINLTLQLRKELMTTRKVAKFWKSAAKEDAKHADLITPSASCLSDVREPLPEERQRAVDDLMLKLRKGIRHTRSESLPVSPQPVATLGAKFGTMRSAPSIRNKLANSGLVVDESKDVASLSTSSSASESTIRSSAAPSNYTLPPLASESFRIELASRTSAERLFRRSSSKASSRPVLKEVDMNTRSSSRILPKSESLTSQSSRKSAKAMGKRRAMIVTQSIDSITASIRSEERERVTASPSDPFSAPSSVDTFTSTLTKSLLKVREMLPQHGPEVPRRQRPESVDSVPFDNSVFGNMAKSTSVLDDLVEEVKITTLVDKHCDTTSPSTTTDDEQCDTAHRKNAPVVLRSHPRSLVMIAEESETSLTASADTSARVCTPDGSSKFTTLRDRDSSFGAGTTSTAPTTPEKEKEASSSPSPGKNSRLPVLKNLRKMTLSRSNAPSATNGGIFKPTSPLTVRKRSRDFASTIPTAVKAPLETPSSSPPRVTKTSVSGSRIATSGRKMAKRLSLSFT